MGTWITSVGPIKQSIDNGKFITLTNQLFKSDDGNIYLVPRNTVTDNYTIPFGINKDRYDVRPSHLHDIACCYHQVIKVNLPLEELENNYLGVIFNNVVCKDIEPKYLQIVDVDFKTTNRLLKEGMESIISIPKYKSILYYIAVWFNIHYALTGIDNIELNKLYNNKLYT